MDFGMDMTGNGPVITGSYDFRLVALSVLIATFASYAALGSGRQGNRRARQNPNRVAPGRRHGDGDRNMVDALRRHAGLQPAGPGALRLAHRTLSLLAAIFASAIALFI